MSVEFTGTARFEVRARLGQGGMGVVYEAWDRERDLEVALKTLRLADGQALYRFKTEFRALADLEHRNLVRLGELHHDGGAWFFTMELVRGTDFLRWVWGLPPEEVDPAAFERTLDMAAAAGGDAIGQRPETLDEARLRDALAQLACGLEALHASGKVHRDIKPSNVMVTHKGRVVVLDFGLVAEVTSGPPSDSNVVGTAAYMAPEQALSPVVGPAADWYAVGVMLYLALTGRLPFQGAPLDVLMRKQRELPPSPDEVAAGVPEDLAELCMDLLATDPAARPDAGAVLLRLGAVARPASPVTPPSTAMPFVGRERELAVLGAALDDVARRGAVTVLVDGESGIGKSALVRRFLEDVEDRRPGTLVLAARCYERECMAFKAMDGIIDALTRHLYRADPVEVAQALPADMAALARLFPVLHRVPAIARLTMPRVRNPLEVRDRAFRALRALLDHLARVRPVVLVIDDFQWADADSVALLTELLHPPAAPRVLLLATRRDGAPGGGALTLPGDVRRLAVERLPPDEARRFVELLRDPGQHQPTSIAEDAGGHPLFILELLRHEAAVGTPARGALSLDDALWSRVHRLEAPARRLLEVVAVAGAPIAQLAVAHAAGLEMPACAKHVGALRAAMLVRTSGVRGNDTIEPYHDRVRETVLARVAPTRRARIHALLAAALESAGWATSDPITLVRHLEAAGEGERAAALAERAASRAVEAFAFDQAAELYATALRLGTHTPAERRALERARAEVLASAGCGPEAAAAYLAAADGAEDPDERFHCRRCAAEQLLISGHLEGGLEILDGVLAEIGLTRPRSGRAARLGVALRWLGLRLRGRRWTPRPASAIPARELMRLDVFRSVSLGMAMIDSTVGADYQARGLRLALKLGEPVRLAQALGFHALYLASVSARLFPAAERWAGEAQRIAAARDDAALHAWAGTVGGVLDYFAGRYRRADERLTEAEAMFREHTVGTTSELTQLRVFLVMTLRRTGAFARLRALYQDWVRDAARRGDHYMETTLIWAGNLGWLAADDVEHARSELARASWSPPAQGYHLQHWLATRARFEAALYVGDDAALAQLEHELDHFDHSQFARLQVLRAESAWMRGRLALLRHGGAGVVAARREVRRLGREGIHYARCWSAMLEAGALVAEGKPARDAWARAATLCDDGDMPILASAARRELGRIEEEEAWQREQGVAAPDRFAVVLTGLRGQRLLRGT